MGIVACTTLRVVLIHRQQWFEVTGRMLHHLQPSPICQVMNIHVANMTEMLTVTRSNTLNSVSHER